MGLQVFEPKDKSVLTRALHREGHTEKGRSPFLSGPSSGLISVSWSWGEEGLTWEQHRYSQVACESLWQCSYAGEPVSEQEVERGGLHPGAEKSSDQGPAVTTAMSNCGST